MVLKKSFTTVLTFQLRVLNLQNLLCQYLPISLQGLHEEENQAKHRKRKYQLLLQNSHSQPAKQPNIVLQCFRAFHIRAHYFQPKIYQHQQQRFHQHLNRLLLKLFNNHLCLLCQRINLFLRRNRQLLRQQNTLRKFLVSNLCFIVRKHQKTFYYPNKRRQNNDIKECFYAI